MKRLIALLKLDFMAQYRYGFLAAALVVCLVYMAMLIALPADILRFLISFALWADLSIIGFYFMAAMVLFEKAQFSLQALSVTPINWHEWLNSKLISLTVLAIFASLLVEIVLVGFSVNFVIIIIAVSLSSIMFVLIGFIAVASYSNVSDFMVPSLMYVLVLSLPAFDYFGLWSHWIYNLVPTQASLYLFQWAFEPIATWKIYYAISYLLVTNIALYFWARQRYLKYVIA